MNKTTVDDMLMQMTKPQLDDIETRFTNGEPLESKDINTLLLKSQYNHINHLDEKLNDVTDNVISLRNEFAGLEGRFAGLEGKFIHLENRFENLEDKVDNRFTLLDSRITGLEKNMDTKITGLEKSMEVRFSAFDEKLLTLQTSIKLDVSEAMNKNTRWSLGLIALLVGVLKLAEVFAK